VSATLAVEFALDARVSATLERVRAAHPSARVANQFTPTERPPAAITILFP
jgi:hypothetical protein